MPYCWQWIVLNNVSIAQQIVEGVAETTDKVRGIEVTGVQERGHIAEGSQHARRVAQHVMQAYASELSDWTTKATSEQCAQKHTESDALRGNPLLLNSSLSSTE